RHGRGLHVLSADRGDAPGLDSRRRDARSDPEQRAGHGEPARHAGSLVTPDAGGAGAVLALDRVNTFRGSAHALRDVSLQVGDRESVCLVGRNGAGKTTTIDSIMVLLSVRSGTVTFKGRDI